MKTISLTLSLYPRKCSRGWSNTSTMIVKCDVNYEAPEIEVKELYSEGVLCSSNEKLDETEGEW